MASASLATHSIEEIALPVVVDGVETYIRLSPGENPHAAAQLFCTTHRIQDASAVEVLAARLQELVRKTWYSRVNWPSAKTEDAPEPSTTENVDLETNLAGSDETRSLSNQRSVETDDHAADLRHGAENNGSFSAVNPAVGSQNRSSGADGATDQRLVENSKNNSRNVPETDSDGVRSAEYSEIGSRPVPTNDLVQDGCVGHVEGRTSEDVSDVGGSEKAGEERMQEDPAPAKTVQEIAAEMREVAQKSYEQADPTAVLVPMEVNGLSAPLLFRFSRSVEDADIKDGVENNNSDGDHFEGSVFEQEVKLAAEQFCRTFGSDLKADRLFVEKDIIKAWHLKKQQAADLHEKRNTGEANHSTMQSEIVHSSAKRNKRETPRHEQRMTLTSVLAPDVVKGTNIFWVEVKPNLPRVYVTAGSSALEISEKFCHRNNLGPSEIPLVAWKVLDTYPLQMQNARRDNAMPPATISLAYAVRQREVQVAAIVLAAGWLIWRHVLGRRRRRLSPCVPGGGPSGGIHGNSSGTSRASTPLSRRTGYSKFYSELLHRVCALDTQTKVAGDGDGSVSDDQRIVKCENSIVMGDREWIKRVSEASWKFLETWGVMKNAEHVAYRSWTVYQRVKREGNKHRLVAQIFGALSGATHRVKECSSFLYRRYYSWLMSRMQQEIREEAPSEARRGDGKTRQQQQQTRGRGSQNKTPRVSPAMKNAKQSSRRVSTMVQEGVLLGGKNESVKKECQMMGSDRLSTSELATRDKEDGKAMPKNGRPMREHDDAAQGEARGQAHTWQDVLDELTGAPRYRFSQSAVLSPAGHILAKTGGLQIEVHEACDWSRLVKNRKGDIIVGGDRFLVVARDETTVIVKSKDYGERIIGTKTKSGTIVLGQYSDMSKSEARESADWLAAALTAAPVR